MSPQLLAAELADREQAALAEADRNFRAAHGPESTWCPMETDEYERLMADVFAIFHMPGGAS